MSRDDLEAVFWSIIAHHKVTVYDAVSFMNDLLSAAEAFSAGDDEELQLHRQQVLHREARPVKPGSGQ
jgi:hypothetical protein